MYGKESNDVVPDSNIIRMKTNDLAPDGNDERHKMRASSTVHAERQHLVETKSEYDTVATQVLDVQKRGACVCIKDDSSTGSASDIVIRSFNKRGPTVDIK